MNEKYIAYKFIIEPKEPATEILIAELGEVGFESFVENENGVTAFILEDDFREELLHDIQILRSTEFQIFYEKEVIEKVNWNSEWEKNFKPIQISNQVSIRAPFHKNPKLPIDIVIEPKMSFGTGHHETTHLMVQQLLNLDFTNKKVLDMGCGTGILAILAEIRGAKSIDAIDIDSWCYENSIENIERNKCTHINVFEGDASLLKTKKYDIIIANINRNILLNDIKTYAACLNANGVLLLSGFYTQDVPMIDSEAKKQGLKFDSQLERHNWVGLKYVN